MSSAMEHTPSFHESLPPPFTNFRELLNETSSSSSSFASSLSPISDHSFSWASSSRSRGGIVLDVLESEQEYVINAELAGIKKEQIQINITDDVLVIEAERISDQKPSVNLIKNDDNDNDNNKTSTNDSTKDNSNKSKSNKASNVFDVCHRERMFGNLKRHIRLPLNADPGRVNAQCENGLLTVRIGKLARVVPQSAAVKIQ